MNMDKLVGEAIQSRASDIHLQEGRRPRLRISGDLVPWGQTPFESGALLPWLCKYGNGELVSQSFSLAGGVRCRCQISAEYAGIHAVIRLLYPLEQLSIADDAALLHRLGRLTQGLVLICGPTGSGKTTTLWKILEYINEEMPKHILTLEDPIEYVLAGKKALISQREIYVHFTSFAAAVREGLRQDPDILLIGEIRDAETMEAAMMAAETGHLVFSTLHAPTVVQAVSRIVSAYAGAEEEVRCRLAFTLQAVIAQRRCFDDGRCYILREILVQTPSVAQLIRSGRDHQLLMVMQTSGSLGMRTMDQAVRKRRGS